MITLLLGLGSAYANAQCDVSAERRKDQVCSEFEYNKVFKRIGEMPPDVKHLILQLGAMFDEIIESVVFIKFHRHPHCISTNGVP